MAELDGLLYSVKQLRDQKLLRKQIAKYTKGELQAQAFSSTKVATKSKV